MCEHIFHNIFNFNGVTVISKAVKQSTKIDDMMENSHFSSYSAPIGDIFLLIEKRAHAIYE
jgi:hypothetical protein